jgi:hypothetical protein
MVLEQMVSCRAERIVKELFPLAECRSIQTQAGLARAIFPDPSRSSDPIGEPQSCDSAAWISAAIWHDEPEW